MKTIDVYGAKTHNLKNINVSIPRNKLVVITGLSGSGKSSLAFDTIYAEGQRRYVESLSTYARQFLSIMDKPEVEHIDGLSPAISIEQKSSSHNPRSTVGTITEIYDYLRLLFARVGTPTCPTHRNSLEAKTISEIVDSILRLGEKTKIVILAQVLENNKGEQIELLSQLKSQGYVRIILNGQIKELAEIDKLPKNKKNSVSVIIDRLIIRDDIKQRLAESLEHAASLTDGNIIIQELDSQKEYFFSTTFACPKCNYSIPKLEPQHFSFNSPQGACETCKGLGVEQYFDPSKIITNQNYSIAEGAISRWSKRNMYYYGIIQSVAKHFGFSCEAPFKELSKQHQDIIFNGSEEIIDFNLIDFHGNAVHKNKKFEGIISNTDKRYKETDSNVIKEELAKFISNRPCECCEGTRLKKFARFVFINDFSLPDITALPIEQATNIIKNIKLTGAKEKICGKISREIFNRLSFLINVGLDYLSLSRTADTLSGGEMQRIRLASQVGSGLVGVTYILDEPSIGLHQKDNDRLCETLFKLRDLGNSVIVVEHDEDTILAADHIIDVGPNAGIHGGEIIAQGTPKQILKEKKSLTGQYLSGAKIMAKPQYKQVSKQTKFLKIVSADRNNLKNVNVDIPIGLITAITGVSGSGKSSLINDTLYNLLRKKLNLTYTSDNNSKAYLEGYSEITNVINITQDPIGRTPRSNPATYTGLFNFIRDLFVKTPEAKTRGYQVGRFSFNVKGGRCEACQGDGITKVEMHFLPDLAVNCDICLGKKYNRETLEIKYKNKNIYDVLNMTVEEAITFFSSIPTILNKLNTLMEVGLSYIQLGQNATTLSGGEAQRLKLSKELSKRETGNTLYILDEPTTGLHFHDISQLLKVIYKLRDKGNTIIIIEHNLDVIASSDWAIDLGPGGGNKGGHILCYGNIKDITKNKKSYTAQYLQKHFAKIKNKSTKSSPLSV